MSTMGTVSFLKDGKLRTIYNPMDSQPNNLGNYLLDFVRRYGVDYISSKIDDMVSDGTESYLCDFDEFLNSQDDSKFYYTDATKFMHNSLICEWSYVIDLDGYEFHVYKGSNKNKPVGLFRDDKPSGKYYPVTLIRTYSLFDLPFKLPKKNLDAHYEEFDIELDDSILDKLSTIARTKKKSLNAVLIDILEEELQNNEAI